MRTLGQTVSNRRFQLGLSQGELARRIGKTQASISKIEAGKQIPSLGMLSLLANALRLKMDEILQGYMMEQMEKKQARLVQ